MTGKRQDVMKATTVRFGPDLWALLEAESARLGVSVSQYIREAALARAAFSAGARADLPSDLLTRWVLTGVRPDAAEDREEAAEQLVAVLEETLRSGPRVEAEALREESAQVRRRAREIRSATGQARVRRSAR